MKPRHLLFQKKKFKMSKLNRDGLRNIYEWKDELPTYTYSQTTDTSTAVQNQISIINQELSFLTAQCNELNIELDKLKNPYSGQIDHMVKRICTLELHLHTLVEENKAYKNKLADTVTVLLDLLSKPIEGQESLDVATQKIGDRFKDIVDNPDIENYIKYHKIIRALVLTFFSDETKTDKWFATDNPMLGDISPRDMIKVGRGEKLMKFVQDSLAENKTI